MDSTGSQTRSPWLTLAGAGIVLAAALAGRTHIDSWLFGSLLLVACGLSAYGFSALQVARALRLVLSVTVLALSVVIWNYLAPQPQIQLGAVRTQSLPSTVSPGVVELVVRNGGSVPAQVVASTAGHLASVSPSAQQLFSAGVEAELTKQLEAAAPLPAAGTTEIPVGQTMRLKVEIPPSQRSWFISRGEATMVVSARLRYRDRLFSRETMFCLFASRAGQWTPCPFLNG